MQEQTWLSKQIAMDGASVCVLSGHEEDIWPLAWSYNGRYIASGSSDMTVRIWEWDGNAGKPLFTCDIHTDGVHTVSWSPDDEYIASASRDSPVHVWARDNGQTLLTYSSQGDAVAWSHNGKYIASFGGNLKTHVWDAQNGQLLHAFLTGPLTSVCWSPDDTRIATASVADMANGNVNDIIVQVWQL